MSSSSNQRRRRICQGVDHISKLPDAILWHILSFISTKSSVKTSILSKRWRYLWTKVPALVFTDLPDFGILSVLPMHQKNYSKDFIDRVLLHNDAGYVHKLRLYIQGDQYFYVNSWLSAITRREIRDIDICFWTSKLNEHLDFISLPTSFLISDRLVALKLVGKFTIDVSAPLHLPNLEIIILSDVKLPNEEFAKTLILGCPVLEEFRIIDCDGISNMLHVESLSLKILEINSTTTKSELSECSIVVKAPNLRVFNLQEACLTEHVRIIDKLSFLVEADLYFENFNDDGFALELVRNLTTVEKLCLGQPAIFGYVGNPPIFQNLTCLRFVADENLNLLLDCAPRLKSLIIERVFFEPEDFLLESKPVPKCLSSLETIQFYDFEGLEEEMVLVAYLLKRTLALKEMNIELHLNYCAKPERDIYLKLLMFRRASAACQVKIDLRRP